jgi:hypothetical protein
MPSSITISAWQSRLTASHRERAGRPDLEPFQHTGTPLREHAETDRGAAEQAEQDQQAGRETVVAADTGYGRE